MNWNYFPELSVSEDKHDLYVLLFIVPMLCTDAQSVIVMRVIKLTRWCRCLKYLVRYWIVASFQLTLNLQWLNGDFSLVIEG